jgi:hypothetical protein
MAAAAILGARVRVPEHVVHRDFSSETVVLNLHSGVYHGLNPTAAQMLHALEASDTVAAAVDRLAAELDQPHAGIESDVISLCRGLADRGLIEIDG